MATLELVFKPLPSILSLVGYHQFLVFTDDNGEKHFVRGGPSTNVNLSMGLIEVQYGAYNNSTASQNKDYPSTIIIENDVEQYIFDQNTYDSWPKKEVYFNSNQDPEAIWSEIVDRVIAIGQSNIMYGGYTNNSNTVITDALVHVGLQPHVSEIPSWQPGGDLSEFWAVLNENLQSPGSGSTFQNRLDPNNNPLPSSTEAWEVSTTFENGISTTEYKKISSTPFRIDQIEYRADGSILYNQSNYENGILSSRITKDTKFLYTSYEMFDENGNIYAKIEGLKNSQTITQTIYEDDNSKSIHVMDKDTLIIMSSQEINEFNKIVSNSIIMPNGSYQTTYYNLDTSKAESIIVKNSDNIKISEIKFYSDSKIKSMETWTPDGNSYNLTEYDSMGRVVEQISRIFSTTTHSIYNEIQNLWITNITNSETNTITINTQSYSGAANTPHKMISSITKINDKLSQEIYYSDGEIISHTNYLNGLKIMRTFSAGLESGYNIYMLDGEQGESERYILTESMNIIGGGIREVNKYYFDSDIVQSKTTFLSSDQIYNKILKIELYRQDETKRAELTYSGDSDDYTGIIYENDGVSIAQQNTSSSIIINNDPRYLEFAQFDSDHNGSLETVRRTYEDGLTFTYSYEEEFDIDTLILALQFESEFFDLKDGTLDGIFNTHGVAIDLQNLDVKGSIHQAAVNNATLQTAENENISDALILSIEEYLTLSIAQEVSQALLASAPMPEYINYYG